MSWYCGWDGGGTKTLVCVQDAVGNTLTEAEFGPLNPNGASPDTVRETVRRSVDFMAAQPGGLAGCEGLVIGFAGVSSSHAAAFVEDAVRQCGYAGPLRLLGDQEIALAGAVDGPGAILIAGTGSICFGRDAQGKPFRCGGYGYLIDDGGSGYAIGRDILAAVARAADGRGPATWLSWAVFTGLRVRDMGGVVTWLYAPETGKKQVAALAPLLLPALDQGDAAAQAIADRAARNLADLAVHAWKTAGMQGGELAMTGSVLRHYAVIRSQTEALIRAALPGIAIGEPRRTAAQGAALLARMTDETRKY